MKSFYHYWGLNSFFKYSLVSTISTFIKKWKDLKKERKKKRQILQVTAS